MADADTFVRVYGLPNYAHGLGVTSVAAPVVTASPAVDSGSAARNVLDQTRANVAKWTDTGTESYLQVDHGATTKGVNYVAALWPYHSGGVDLTLLQWRIVFATDSGFTTGLKYWPGASATDYQSFLIQGSGSTTRKQHTYDNALTAQELARLNAERALHSVIEPGASSTDGAFPQGYTGRYMRVYFKTTEVSPPATSTRQIGALNWGYAYYGDPNNAEAAFADQDHDAPWATSQTVSGTPYSEMSWRRTIRGAELRFIYAHEADTALSFRPALEQHPTSPIGIRMHPDVDWRFHRARDFGLWVPTGWRTESRTKRATYWEEHVAVSLKEAP